MKILILGKGYIGSSILTTLSKCFDVHIVSRADLDYTDRAVLFQELIRGKYEYVINTCGYTGRPNVDACENNKEDTWHYNVVVPVRIQKTCKDACVKLLHVSSGCIYDGYDKEYTEQDEPDFGLLNARSSWYSKTKHACEMMLKDTDTYILRIRMPFCQTNSERNILTKLRRYDSIIDMKNSLTSVEDLGGFMTLLIADLHEDISQIPSGIYNVVNPQPVTTSEITALLDEYGLGNPNWTTISYTQLLTMTATGRSNCVLSDDKITKYNLRLPNTIDSLRKSMECIGDKLHKETIKEIA